jgi:hypothetical protein
MHGPVANPVPPPPPSSLGAHDTRSGRAIEKNRGRDIAAREASRGDFARRLEDLWSFME